MKRHMIETYYDDINIPAEEELHLVIKLLEAAEGYEFAHDLINRARMQYAVMKTNEVLERR